MTRAELDQRCRDRKEHAKVRQLFPDLMARVQMVCETATASTGFDRAEHAARVAAVVARARKENA